LWKVQANVPLDDTLIIGLDINHSKTAPSVAGICATTPDMDFVYTEQCVQEGSGKEMFTKLRSSVHAALRSYFSAKKKFPRQIIVYRDGISEGQMDAAVCQYDSLC
jgi:hypothetical protein